jgi:hypothetical protein
MVISDANQLLGGGASFAAGQLNEIANDPGLGNSIKNFDTTLSNADAGGVLDSVGTVGVDLIQAQFAGFKEIFNNPSPLNIAAATMPGGLLAVGLFSDPGMAVELGKNSVVMLGTAGDFVIGAAQMPSAFIDLTENSMRVGLHELGVSEGVSETASSVFGRVAEATMFSVNPVGVLIGQLPSIDLSGMAQSLFD